MSDLRGRDDGERHPPDEREHGETARLGDARALLAGWALTWDRPGLEEAIRVEISRRLTRSLGRAFPGRGVVRLTHLLLAAPRGAFAEVLCHEAAHVVVFERHGRRARPHGREWAALLRAAGYEPRTRVDPRTLGMAWTPSSPRPRRRSRWVWEHHCGACGLLRRARRAVPQWRCARCLGEGRSGELRIVRRAKRSWWSAVVRAGRA